MIIYVEGQDSENGLNIIRTRDSPDCQRAIPFDRSLAVLTVGVLVLAILAVLAVLAIFAEVQG